VGIAVASFLWNKKFFVGVLVSVAAIVAIGISTSERFANRVLTRSSLEVDSNQERTALWKGNWAMVKDYPVFGVGLGANKSHLRKYYDEFGYPPGQRESHAHNQYLQYWAGTGTLGFFCFLSFLFIILRYAYAGIKSNKSEFDEKLFLGLLAALLCFLVGSLTESNFNIAKNRFFFLLIASIAIAWSGSNSNARSSN
jgi:O-antigen ligase